ncbi:MAG: hypothetical protein ABIQ89_03720 [Candidatus Saccharimonadales bacterium]
MIVDSISSTEYPENPFDVGIDARVERELRSLVLDESILITNTSRAASENTHNWDEESLVDYGEWLCKLLKISVEDGDNPVSVIQISRAAKLGVGPSRERIEKELDGGVPELQEKLGFLSRDRYGDWSKQQCIEAGKALADKLGRRPSTPQFKTAFANGEFLSIAKIISKFDSIQNLQELIGRPSARGWTADDHAEWGAAIKRQYGADTRITSGMIRKFSAQGKGPNCKAISKHFSSLEIFNEKATAEYWSQLDLEEQDMEFWRDQTKQILDSQDELANAVVELEETEIITVVARFQLINKLLPSIEQERAIRTALHDDPDYLVQWMTQYFPEIKVADIENTASIIRVFNILWPMYRFQNVDFKSI